MTAPAGPPGRGLGRAFLRYTLLRLAILAVSYVIAAAVLVPLLGVHHPAAWLDAGLAALLLTLPLAYKLGAGLREELDAAITAQRAQRRAQLADYEARVRAGRTPERPQPHAD